MKRSPSRPFSPIIYFWLTFYILDMLYLHSINLIDEDLETISPIYVFLGSDFYPLPLAIFCVRKA